MRAHGLGSSLTNAIDKTFNWEQLKNDYSDSEDITPFVHSVGALRVAYLSVQVRAEFLNRQVNAYDLDREHPSHPIQWLYANVEAEQELSDLFEELFNEQLRFYNGSQIHYELRVGKSLPPPDENRSATKVQDIRTISYSISEAGDGYKSVATTALAALACKGRVLLVDEPDAYLHPEQQWRLGKWLGDKWDRIPGQIITATHSAPFLSGLLASGCPIEICRLHRADDETTFVHVPVETSRRLSSHPVLSSQRVVEGYFHRGVLVCEGESDRMVYQTALERTLSHHEVYVVHAQNKQTVHSIVDVLRQASIPVCAIVDLDILHNGQDFKRLLQSFGFAPEEETKHMEARKAIIEAVATSSPDEALSQLPVKLRSLIESIERGGALAQDTERRLRELTRSLKMTSELKSKGVLGAPEEIREKIEELLAELRGHGLHIVPAGELEGWFPAISRSIGKQKWTQQAVEWLLSNGCPEPLRVFLDDVIAHVRIACIGDEFIRASS